MSELVEVGEHKEKVLGNKVKDNDLNYLKYFQNKKPDSFKLNRNLDGKLKIENTSYAGIIQLEDTRLYFSTKVKANLFYMLSFLKSENNFIFDPYTIIDIKEGGSFFDILGRLFYNELEDIVSKGLLKKYVKREENLNYLKGKLLLNEHLKQNLMHNPKFYCQYHDLTFDNLENQILLRATNLLIPMIRYDESLRYNLIRQEMRLKEEITLNQGVSQRECDLISYDRMNQHYKPIIDFSRIIFEENFIRSVNKGESKGFNFIVNMWQVYEDFVTEMIRETIKEDSEFNDYAIVSQLPFNTLVKERNIITRPDIILKKKGTEKYPLILDAKYKRSEANKDFYQVIAYSLAIPSSQKCCLLYPESQVNDSDYTVVKDVIDENSDTVKLYTKTISLFEETGENFDAFIQRIKSEQVKPMLKDLLGNLIL